MAKLIPLYAMDLYGEITSYDSYAHFGNSNGLTARTVGIRIRYSDPIFINNQLVATSKSKLLSKDIPLTKLVRWGDILLFKEGSFIGSFRTIGDLLRRVSNTKEGEQYYRMRRTGNLMDGYKVKIHFMGELYDYTGGDGRRAPRSVKAIHVITGETHIYPTARLAAEDLELNVITLNSRLNNNDIKPLAKTWIVTTDLNFDLPSGKAPRADNEFSKFKTIVAPNIELLDKDSPVDPDHIIDTGYIGSDLKRWYNGSLDMCDDDNITIDTILAADIKDSKNG